MKYLILLLFTLSLMASDPITNQPNIGGRYLIVATNGYANTLHFQTSSGAHTLTLTTDSSGDLTGQIDSGTVYTIVPPTGSEHQWTNISNVLSPIDNPGIISFATTNGLITFGPGTTNVLYRSGSDLVYTNGDSIPLFKVVNGSGAYGTLGLNTGGSAVLNSSSGAIYFDSRQVTKGIGPLTHNLYTIGSAGTAYSDIHSISNVVHSKFDAGGTNYSLVNMYHTGTNGNVVFDSKGSGTAGGAREFIFSSNGTTRAQITFTQTNRDAFISDGSKMILQKPNLFMADDGYEYLVRVPVSDTSGNLKRIFMGTGTDTDLNFGAKSQIYLLTESPDANTKQAYFQQLVINNDASDNMTLASDVRFTSGSPLYRWLISNFATGNNLVDFTGTNFTFNTLSTINATNGFWKVQNNNTDELTVYGGGSVKHRFTATPGSASTLSSGATITPTAPIHFVSGTTTIDTITAPNPISLTGGQITLIPTGIWATSTSGNVALATTAVVNKALIMTWDATAAKWYPSY